MSDFFGALGRVVVRHRYLVVAVWILGTIAAVAILPSLASQVNDNNGAFLPKSAPSNQAAVLAQPLIGPVTQSSVPVVAFTDGRPLDVADQEALRTLLANLGHVPTTLSVEYLGTSPDQEAAQLLLVSSTSPFNQGQGDTLIDDMQGTIARTPLPAGLQAHLAGQLATNAAANKQSARQSGEIQDASFLFIVVLLLLIFRSLLAPLITLVPAALVLLLSGAFIGALGGVGALQVSFFTQILLIVLVLGAGTDYGLFLVFRVREQLHAGSEPDEAVAYAVRRVGESITASASTVIVALLTLLAASFGLYHDLGVPLAIGIATMLLAGLTLLPALLAIFGRAVFWPTRTVARPQAEGIWGRVAARLVRRPLLTLLVGVAALGILAVFALGFVPTGFGGDVVAPAGTDAAKGNAALAAHFPQASANPTDVVMHFPTSVWVDPAQLATATEGLHHSGEFRTITGPLNPNGTALTPAQLGSLYSRVHPYGSAQELVTRPLAPPAGSGIPPADYITYLTTARYVSADGHTVLWSTGLAAGSSGSNAAISAVPVVRQKVDTVARHAGADANGVAGEAPALYDVSSISNGDVGKIVPIAILAIGLVLALVLRSLVAPAYLILSVVLSYLASLGISVIVFMKIPGNSGIVFLLPFLMFIFLLALGEDYNILVMTRIREEARGHQLEGAVIRAVGATGPTVTSAGLVLAGTFVVLAVVGGSGQGNGEIRVIGVGLAIGILLDTFVVRTVLVPSIVELLGRWNWWPSRMSRPAATPDAT
ncbi:MAG: MMPL family transporter [Acidimicrobiales bacterium]